MAVRRNARRPDDRRVLLDCARVSTCIYWFLIGCALAALIMRVAEHSLGGWVGLLRVGTSNPLFAQIQRELGPLPTSEALGHDGQLYYLIARDPFGTHGTPQAITSFEENGPRYRYRRILYPLLAGGFGELSGRATFAAMIVFVILGTGLGAVGLADLAFHLHLTPRTVLVALVNPGALIGLWLLVSDPLAIGLALVGIALTLRRRLGWGIAACALAALAKETYLVVPAALAAWHWQQGARRHAMAFFLAATVPLIAWDAWLRASMPAGSAVARNLGMPFVGLAGAIPMWIHHEQNPIELVLAACACLALIAAFLSWVPGTPSVLRWLVIPWIVLGLVATVRVWGPPNNAARSLALLWPLSVFLIADRILRARRRLDPTSAPATS